MPYFEPHDEIEILTRITDLENYVDLLQAEIDSAEGGIATNTSHISAINSQITAIQSAITSLQAAQKRTEIYNGTTNASGVYTVVFNTPYAVAPHVNPQTVPPANSVTRVRVTSVSTTGFTVQTETNGGLTVLGLSVLGLATTIVPNVNVSVLVRAR